MNNYIKPVSAGFSSSSSVILSRNVHHFGALPNVYKEIYMIEGLSLFLEHTGI
jgi:hypothetical protein